MKNIKLFLTFVICIIAVFSASTAVHAASLNRTNSLISDFEVVIQRKKLIGNTINFRVVSNNGSQNYSCYTTIDGYAAPLSTCNFSVKLYEPRIYTATTYVVYNSGQLATLTTPFQVGGMYELTHDEKVSLNTPVYFTVGSKQYDVQQSPMTCNFYVDGGHIASATDCSNPLSFDTPGEHLVEVKMNGAYQWPFTAVQKVIQVGS